MGRLFEHPALLAVVILLIILLFGAPKLPIMARSLGQSMRVFKSEVDEMKSDSSQENKNGGSEGVVVANKDHIGTSNSSTETTGVKEEYSHRQ